METQTDKDVTPSRTWYDGSADRTETFCYDNLHRLTSARIGTACTGSGAQGVTYDLAGNITAKSDAGAYTYGAGAAGPHAVTSIDGAVGGVTDPAFSYDANGNLTGVTGTFARSLAWTPMGRVKEIAAGGATLTYAYDTEHQRIKEVTDGASDFTTLYLSDPVSGAAAERQQTGASVKWSDYLFASGKRVAVRFLTDGATASMRYFVADHLGSVAVVTKGNGDIDIDGRTSFDAWGLKRNPDGTGDQCEAAMPVTRGPRVKPGGMLHRSRAHIRSLHDQHERAGL